jgi:hypothetical protein
VIAYVPRAVVGKMGAAMIGKLADVANESSKDAVRTSEKALFKNP